jgi:hypothetical protein
VQDFVEVYPKKRQFNLRIYLNIPKKYLAVPAFGDREGEKITWDEIGKKIVLLETQYQSRLTL